MKKYTEMRKKLIISLIALSLSMTLIPITGSAPIEKEQSMKTMSCSDGIIISGWMGENGWYRSNVQIRLNVTGPINHTYYNIDNGGWTEYTVPVLVDTEGYHTACFYYVDHWGQSHMYNATFKIDKTLPEITLTKETVGFGQIKFVANVSDAISGVWRVEFYIDDEPMFTDFDFPFESNVFWAGKHNVVAIVFDFAGNSQIGSMTTSYVIGGTGMSLNPTEISTTTINHFQKDLNKRECSSLLGNITVTFTYPENGIYWNDRKIMPYSVPLILHGNGDLVHHLFRFYRDTPVNYTITGAIIMVEFYFDGVLIGTVTAPPYEFKLPTQMTSFSHINIKIIAYGTTQGDWGSDEITIWRLFV